MATMQLNIVLASGQWTLRSWELYLVDCHPVGSRNIAWENNHRSDGRLHTLPAEPTPVQTWLSLRLWLPLVPQDSYCLSDFSVLSYVFLHFHAIVSAMAVPQAHVWKWFESILRFSIVLFSIMDKSLVKEPWNNCLVYCINFYNDSACFDIGKPQSLLVRKDWIKGLHRPFFFFFLLITKSFRSIIYLTNPRLYCLHWGLDE